MSMVDSMTISALSKFLDLTVQRQNLVSSNMANIDTPGYKTRDIDFRAELMKFGGGQEAGARPQVKAVEGLMERPDGNNVSMEREALLQAHNQLQFQVGIQLLRSEFHKWQTAISEGAR